MATKLGSILDMQANGVDKIEKSHDRKRQKVDDNNNGRKVIEVICEGLEDVWRSSKNDNNVNINTIELEVRLGMIIDHDHRWRAQRPCDITKEGAISTKQVPLQTSLQFKAGVDEIAIERMKRILNDKKRFNKDNKPIEKVLIDKGKTRWILNDDGTKKGENKTRFEKNDCSLLAYEYDIRIDGNYETTVKPVDGLINVDVKCECERIKRRTTYTSITNEFSAWKIDVTEVNSVNFNERNSPYGQSHEFEFEFELVNLDLFKQTEVEKARGIIREIGSQLFKLINLFIPNDVATNSGQSMIPCVSPFIVDEIKKLNLKISGVSNGDFTFIGSMPTNMMRSSFKKVLRTDYYLTEKSDGTRYLMYVVPQDNETKKPIAVFIDRAKNIFTLPGSDVIGQSLALGTVLDGELVYNFSIKSNIFLAFDILALKGVSKVVYNFKKRLELLQELMKSYRISMPPPVDGITIIPIADKLYVEKRDISNLLSKIILENGDRVYKDGDGRIRHHRTDGIIFQPDGPYVHSTDSSLLKWKWSELRSIDLEVVQPIHITEGAKLQCGGPDNTRIDCINGNSNQSKLGIFDTYRLNADVNAIKNKIIIAEVAFDEKIGKWGYLKLRKDKNEPNYITTVLGVSMEQSEALGIEELEFRLLAKNETQDDWDIHFNKMVSQLLGFQRQRINS